MGICSFIFFMTANILEIVSDVKHEKSLSETEGETQDVPVPQESE